MRKLILTVAALLLTTSACTTERTDEPLRVIAIFGTPIDEPWVSVIHEALLRAETELAIEYEFTDDVDPAEFEEIIRDHASGHCDIIMGDGFAVEDTIRRVAPDYPDTAFLFGSGRGPAEPNLSVFDNWIHEPAYLAGMLAGRLTKTNTIGAVGGYPVPEVNRLLNAFAAGARDVNPDAELRVTFIESWFDEAAANAAAAALIEQDADVIYGERAGVIEACAARGVPAIGNLKDRSSLAPETVVTSVLWDMWPTVEQVITRVRAGSYTAEDYGEWSRMPKGGSSLAPIQSPWDSRLDPAALAEVAAKSEAILNGSFAVPVIETAPPDSP